MVGPTSFLSRLLLALSILTLVYFLYMDVCLYFRIQHYPLRRVTENGTSHEEFFLSCDLSPLCDVTVKSMMLDHPNQYLFGPIAILIDRAFGLHYNEFITPNMISFFHVFVALISAKCVALDSIIYRRIGVLLFEVRNMLDDLDGQVARERKNIRGASSEFGSVGYFVDGVCDGIGTIALLFGCLVYLKNNPPRRGYMQVTSTILPQTIDTVKDFGVGVPYKVKTTSNKILQKLICLGGQMLLSSILWNRYVALYQDLLERRNVSEKQATYQIQALRSLLMWTVTWLWRVLSPHAIIHFTLIAIFCDRLWEFLRAIQYIGFILLLGLICISEMHTMEVQSFIQKAMNSNATAV